MTALHNKIELQLKNSYIPMLLLQNIYLTDGVTNVCIDYMVFTRKICFVISCGNDIGSVGKNRKDLQVIKKIMLDKPTNSFRQVLMNKYSEDYYKFILITDNSTNLLDSILTKNAWKDPNVPIEQLIPFIKDAYQHSKESELSDKQLYQWAQSFINRHTAYKIEITPKFDHYMIGLQGMNKTKEVGSDVTQPTENKSDDNLEAYKQLMMLREKQKRQK